MDVSKAIRERRSVRQFTDRPVEKEKIARLIDAAQWAPSACNKQMWEFVVVTDDNLKERIAKEAGTIAFVKTTPVVIFVFYDKEVTKEWQANIQSAAAATQNMLLEAHNLGLGGVWICAYGNEDKVKKILRVPDRMKLVCAAFIGYPKDTPMAPSRRDVSEIMHDNYYSSNDQKYGERDPRKWTEEAVEDYRMKGIRATSPFPNAFPAPFPDEFRKEIELTLKSIGPKDRVLDILSYAGTYALELLKAMPEISIHETSKETCEFIRKRKENTSVKGKLDCRIGSLSKIPYDDSTFDVVTCLNKIEMHPSPEKLISEIARVLKKDGKLVLSFWNSKSIFGLRNRLKKDRRPQSNEGPVKPLSMKEVESMIKKAGFRVKRSFGINLVPRRGVAGKAKMEGHCSSGTSKKFCRTIWMECVKAD